MASIDERVVAMSFENKVFEARAAQTMATLGKLSQAVRSVGNVQGLENIEKSGNKVTLQAPLNALDKLRAKFSSIGQGAEGIQNIEKASDKVTLEGANRAIDKTQANLSGLSAGNTFGEIEKSADRVTLGGITRALENVSGQFSLLQGAASVAFGNITSQAAMKGAAFAKSFSLGPIQQGFEEYQTNLGSIQTILANTKASGADLRDVNAALDELNHYSDQTIYNFSQMATNIGLFTAAGVDLKTSVSSIKGLANLAALSGSNNEKATHAMEQLSQAVAAGRVTMQDWISVRNAGMGGTVFQRALAQTAEAMGTIKKGAVSLEGPMKNVKINGEAFTEAIRAKPGQESWLTSKVLTTTLAGMTGDLTDAQLAAQGFNDEQIQSIQETAKAAKLAATEVKTLPQAFDVAKETIGSGWSQTFKNIFGDFEESKKTFTEFSNTINGFINENADARNKVLADWKKLGGRTELIEGIKAAFQDVMAIIKPIGDAFRDIFPRKTVSELIEMTKNFRDFMEQLKPGEQTIENIRRTFAGLFAVVHIGWSIVKGLIGVIFDLLGVVGEGSGGFLSFAGGIGDFLVAVDTALTKGDLLKGIFKGIGAVLEVPIRLIGALATAIATLFTGGKDEAAKGFEDSIDRVGQKLGPLKVVVDLVNKAWEKLVDLLGRAKTALEPWFDTMVDKVKNFASGVADALSQLNFEKVMSGLQTGLVAGIFVTLKKAIGGGVSIFGDAFEGVNELLGGFTKNLEAMQKNIQANTLLQIAAAILALAAGIKILSTINGEDLTRSMTAVAVGLGELMGAMRLMTGGLGKFGALQLPLIAAGMIGLSIAITILAGAMKIFATMQWEDIAKGLAGVGGALAAVGLGLKLMPPTMPLTAAGLILVGAGLVVIASAVKAFAQMKLGDMAKGIFAVVEALAGIALGVSMMPPTLPLTAAGLILMGIALSAIGGALRSMGSMDFGTIIKGLVAMMAALAGIGLAVSLIPPTIALTAVGLLVVGEALVVVAAAMKIMGSMGVGAIAKSLVAMAGALLILAGGLTLMIATLPGSVALLAAAAALAVLAPTLGLLGTMKWSTIFKGLAAIGLVLVTVGIAGLIAAPALAALGIALIPLGVGFMLVASAAKIFASAMALMSSEGQKGIAIFLTAVTGFIAILPTIIINFIKGLVGIVGEIAKILPQVIVALGVVIDQIIAFVIASAPKLAVAIGVLVAQIVTVLGTNAPKLIAAGMTLLSNLLDGLSQNIGTITNKAADVITKFLSALSAKAPDLVAAGAKTLISFVQGITNNVGKVVAAVASMVAKFVTALGNNVGKVVSAGQDVVLKLIGGILSILPQLVSLGSSIILKFLSGLEEAIPKIRNKALAVAKSFMTNLATGLSGLADVAFKALITFLNGIETAIRNNEEDLFNAGAGIADAIIDGLVDKFGKLGGVLRTALTKVFELLPGYAKKILGIKSPSTVFAEIGKFTMLGFKQGVEDNAHEVTDAGDSIGGGLISSFRKVLGIHSPSEVMRDIGMQVNRGFSEGLRGSADQVVSAFGSLNDALRDKIRDMKTQIAEGNQRIEDLQQQHADKLAEIAKLQGEKKPDKDAIAAAVKEAADLTKQIQAESVAVNQNEKVLKANRAARAELTKGLSAEKAQLLTLKTAYEDITKQVEKAQSDLEDIQRQRADALKSYTDQYSAAPDIDQDAKDKVTAFEDEIKKRIEAVNKYAATLQKLRALGLDDATYKKLLTEGTQDQDFADQLLTSGKRGVDELNKMNAELAAAAAKLGKDASDNLFDAAEKAAVAFVDKLRASQADIQKVMDDIADGMVKAIKTKLKIKSPSRVFEELGKFTARGLIDGMRGSTQAIVDASGNMGDNAASAMVDSISRMRDAISAEVDPDLTITPVLDLTKVQQGAKQLGELTNVTPITAAASYGQASATNEEVAAAKAAAAESAAQAGPSFNFEQNNYSPEALNDVEIYRKTRNQLGQVKQALGLAG